MYEISSHGRIRSLRYVSDGQPLVMSLVLTKGYLQTRVTMDDGRKKTIFAHRAVCEIWHGPCPSPAHVVAHRRDVRTLNTPDELHWATRSENARAAIENGAHITRRGYVRGHQGDLTVF
ncbi:MAG TPA: HNH endonuclease [Nannocystis sp.]